ncbi:hypothetical protein BCLUESOX_2209 [bacterium endosymbiont of Bathymodiolus sp. 5 South]|nr:hypothetical protein BCLUESOX_2209 [bacterium endosymbiont of Bathymodiolus sp. 5 South]VVH55058.1 hypothetical protein BSPCLSOX_2222 [uncultured Gammaproteobacteria bacterium]VVH62959.1 hypothetical protein BSPWISOX_2352 [uncultured Gammaproteobacteria bacterium]
MDFANHPYLCKGLIIKRKHNLIIFAVMYSYILGGEQYNRPHSKRMFYR